MGAFDEDITWESSLTLSLLTMVVKESNDCSGVGDKIFQWLDIIQKYPNPN